MRRFSPALLFAFAAASCASASASSAMTNAPSLWAASNPDWVEPIEPFRIHGDIFYVGTRGLSSFLIATPEGHFLIDGGLPENAPIIAANIGKLGYDVKDIKYLLNSHAHFDHSGGLAALKEETGATMIASEGDKWALETGLVPGSENDPDMAAPPVKVDRTIGDGENLTLGGVMLTARLTPGHTEGCTSWTMNSSGREVLFFCSATVAANRLIGPPQYEGIVEDYRATFARTKDWRPDILLANHPGFFDMEEKRARQVAGDEAAFVDAEGFPAMMTKLEAAFEKAFAEQTAKAEKR
ncbi:MAG: subclass B3 metallo-beta-lactamase [Pseudomonadota bacterium]